MLDSSTEHGLPEFEFIHCIPLNPTNEADPKVFRATDHDGSKGPHGSKPFMKGGDCRCEYTQSIPIVLSSIEMNRSRISLSYQTSRLVV